MQTVCAAIVHDIGKLSYPAESVYGDTEDEKELLELYNAQMRASDLIEGAFASDGVSIKCICGQVKAQTEMMTNQSSDICPGGGQCIGTTNSKDEL